MVDSSSYVTNPFTHFRRRDYCVDLIVIWLVSWKNPVLPLADTKKSTVQLAKMPRLFFIRFNLEANQPQIPSMTDWLLGYKVEVEFEYKNQKSHTKVSSWRNLSKIALVFMRIRSQFKFVCIGRRSFIIPLCIDNNLNIFHTS